MENVDCLLPEFPTTAVQSQCLRRPCKYNCLSGMEGFDVEVDSIADLRISLMSRKGLLMQDLRLDSLLDPSLDQFPES